MVAVTGARSFDPEVNDQENEELAGRAVDGNSSTEWHTQTYASRGFGNLKSGVGLIVDLGSVQSLGQIAIASPSTGWAASIYAADGAPGSLDGWGEPVAQASDIAGTLRLDLHGARSDSVLIWITDLGTANRVEIAEVALAG